MKAHRLYENRSIIPQIWKHAIFTIFSGHVMSVNIIYLSFHPLKIRKIACFTVERSLTRIACQNMACRKMNENTIYT